MVLCESQPQVVESLQAQIRVGPQGTDGQSVAATAGHRSIAEEGTESTSTLGEPCGVRERRKETEERKSGARRGTEGKMLPDHRGYYREDSSQERGNTSKPCYDRSWVLILLGEYEEKEREKEE